MKLKPNLDSKAAQGFFQQHVEKIALGLAVIALLALAFTSIGKEHLGWQPDELLADANAAENRIETNTRVFDDEMRDYEEEVRHGLKVVVGVTNYEHEAPWDAPIFEEKGKRGEPAVFPVLDLRATAGQGPVQMTPEEYLRSRRVLLPGETLEDRPFEAEASANVEGQRWVVVTGLLPAKRQLNAHMDALAGASYTDDSLDIPAYVLSEVERHEVGKDDENGEPIWERVKILEEATKTFERWSGTASEVVRSIYIPAQPPGAMPMAFNLPPLAAGEFGEEVAHPPEILLDEDQTAKEFQEFLAKQEAANQGTLTIEELIDRFAREQQERLGGSRGGGGGGDGDDEDDGGGGGGGSSYSSSGGGEWWQRQQQIIEEGDETIDHQLYRVFDFTVEPNKTYQYRVKLHLVNPNFRLPERFLENPDFAKRKTLETVYSKPSPPVFVPVDSRLLLVEGSESTRPWYDPSGEVMSILFDMETGLESVDTFTVRRGMVANFMNKVLHLAGSEPEGMEDSSYGGDEDYEEEDESYDEDEEGGGGGGYGYRADDEEEERTIVHKVDYISNMLVGDLIGGQRQCGRGTEEPSAMMLIAPDGSMLVQSQESDLENYLRYKDPEPVDEDGSGYGGYN